MDHDLAHLKEPKLHKTNRVLNLIPNERVLNLGIVFHYTKTITHFSE